MSALVARARCRSRRARRGIGHPLKTGDSGFYTEETAGNVALYRFNAVTDTRETLTDNTAEVMGVVGASENGESVYFVAGGVLGSGINGEGAAAKAGQPNLYLQGAGGAPVFIATLSPADGSEMQPYLRVLENGPREYGDWQPGLGQRTAEVAAGGSGVVFMSDQSLSVVGFPKGYPNPNGFEEVYMFEAGADRLFCVSCSSTGKRHRPRSVKRQHFCRLAGVIRICRGGFPATATRCSLIVRCRWSRRTRTAARMCMSGSVKARVAAVLAMV